MEPSEMSSIPAAILAEAQRQHAILSRGTAAIYPGPDRHGLDGLHHKLAKSVADNRPLKVKFGMDPTAPDLHLGHCVVLNGLRRFQDLGHIAQPLIGDYTARIGDPSGRNKTRPPLSGEAIDANAQTYFDQVFRILDRNSDKLELLYNGQWLAKLSFAETIKLCAQATVAQILSREDFATRLSNNTPISMHELLYPIMQGYDSIVMNCDIEFGGTDQTFNCLMGRQLMQARGLEPQIVITFPLLEGTDGVEKMSKSTRNYIALTDTPADMYGKLMSIPDRILSRYYDLLTDIRADERVSDPYGAKKALAHLITARFHDAGAADGAAQDFATRFSARQIPADLPEETVDLPEGGLGLLKLLCQLDFASSNSEARRLVEQSAVKMDGNGLIDPRHRFSKPATFVLAAGKRRMARVTLK
jgi:tyrosyl-tRNA synthetase